MAANSRIPGNLSALQSSLASLSELELQSRVVEPLLRAEGFASVRDVSGPNEKGKDLIAIKYEFLRPVLYAIQLKKVTITGNANRWSNSMNQLCAQLKDAVDEDIYDFVAGVRRQPDRLIFVTPLPIERHILESSVAKLAGLSTKQIRIIDGHILADLVYKLLPSLVPTLDRKLAFAMEAEIEANKIPELAALGLTRTIQLSDIYVEVNLKYLDELRSLVAVVLQDWSRQYRGVDEQSKGFRVRNTLAHESRSLNEAEWHQIEQLGRGWLLDSAHQLKDKRASGLLEAIYSQIAALEDCLGDGGNASEPLGEIYRLQVLCRAMLRMPGLAGIWRDLSDNELLALRRFEKSLAKREPHVSSQDLSKSPRSLLVVGGPGSGKTSLFRRIWSQRPDYFIFVRAVDLRDIHQVDILQLIWSVGVRESGRSLEEFRKEFASGDLAIIVDGLDELGSTRAMLLASALAVLDQEYPASQILTSIRRSDANVDWPSVLQIGIHPFTDAQRKGFIERWFTAAPSRSANLLAWLDQHEKARAIIATPMLSALLCRLHEADVPFLPTTEKALYAGWLDLLLGEWERAKGFEPMPPSVKDEYVLFLSTLAFAMHSKHGRAVSWKTSKDVASEYFVPGYNSSVGGMVRDCVNRGLIVKDEANPGRWTFAHFTYQEYLCALHMQRVNRLDLLVELIEDPWWAGAFRFYGALLGDVSGLLAHAKAVDATFAPDVLSGLRRGARRPLPALWPRR